MYAKDRLAFRDGESPCIVPNGKYILRGCVLTASDFCALQGLAREGQIRFGLTMLSPILLRDCCGNSFSAPVIGAVLAATLQIWRETKFVAYLDNSSLGLSSAASSQITQAC